jgi:tripartite-type tricarboxylate transporter receptor subunit TctC
MQRRFAMLLPLAMTVAPASAQDQPSKPVRLVVPTAADGMADILARLFALEFSNKIRQPVVVDNRTGAGGVIAAEYVAKSPPDGYTLCHGLHATSAIHIASLPNVSW